jgi:hypothetical protein
MHGNPITVLIGPGYQKSLTKHNFIENTPFPNFIIKACRLEYST